MDQTPQSQYPGWDGGDRIRVYWYAGPPSASVCTVDLPAGVFWQLVDLVAAFDGEHVCILPTAIVADLVEISAFFVDHDSRSSEVEIDDAVASHTPPQVSERSRSQPWRGGMKR